MIYQVCTHRSPKPILATEHFSNWFIIRHNILYVNSMWELPQGLAFGLLIYFFVFQIRKEEDLGFQSWEGKLSGLKSHDKLVGPVACTTVVPDKLFSVNLAFRFNIGSLFGTHNRRRCLWETALVTPSAALLLALWRGIPFFICRLSSINLACLIWKIIKNLDVMPQFSHLKKQLARK